MDTFDRLRQFEILSHLDGQQLDILCGCLARNTYEDGATVLSEGETSDDFYLVDRGTVKIERNTPYGVYSLAGLGPGDLFGETSFLDRQARSGDARAHQDLALYQVRSNLLRPLLESNPRFGMVVYWTLWKSLSIKLRTTNEVLAQFFAEGNEKKVQETSVDQPAEGFKVGVDAKRDLFREQTLSPMEINFLATLSKEKKYSPGEYIFREGEIGDGLYVVLEGRIMIAKDIVGAGEEALAFLERGDYFGEMALIDKKPRSATAKAAHEDGAVVLKISSKVLEGILDIQKVSSLRLLKILCALVAKRLREVDDKLVGWYIFDAGSGTSLGAPMT